MMIPRNNRKRRRPGCCSYSGSSSVSSSSLLIPGILLYFTSPPYIISASATAHENHQHMHAEHQHRKLHLNSPYPWETDTRSISNAKCYDTLSSSDLNNDGRINMEEYSNFISALSNNYFPNIPPYTNLPTVLKANFNLLSCRCNFYPINGNNDCCQGSNKAIHLGTTDLLPSPPLELTEYLQSICDDTMESINYERGPTYEPTAAPIVPTDEPTKSPSDCIDTPNFTDQYGDTCTFYETGYVDFIDALNLGGEHPCTVYGNDGNVDSNRPNLNCCVCMKMLWDVEAEENAEEEVVEEEQDPLSALEEAVLAAVAPVSRPPTTPKPTQKPVTDSPSRRPTPKPVTDKPSRPPTPRPVTGKPSRQPTSKPVTDMPSRKPTQSSPVTNSPSRKPTPNPVKAALEAATSNFGIPPTPPTRQPTLKPVLISNSPMNQPTNRPISPSTDIPTKSPSLTQYPTITGANYGLSMEEIMAQIAADTVSPSKSPSVSATSLVDMYKSLAEEEGDDEDGDSTLGGSTLYSVIAVSVTLSICLAGLATFIVRRRERESKKLKLPPSEEVRCMEIRTEQSPDSHDIEQGNNGASLDALGSLETSIVSSLAQHYNSGAKGHQSSMTEDDRTTNSVSNSHTSLTNSHNSVSTKNSTGSVSSLAQVYGGAKGQPSKTQGEEAVEDDLANSHHSLTNSTSSSIVLDEVPKPTKTSRVKLSSTFEGLAKSTGVGNIEDEKDDGDDDAASKTSNAPSAIISDDSSDVSNWSSSAGDSGWSTDNAHSDIESCSDKSNSDIDSLVASIVEASSLHSKESSKTNFIEPEVEEEILIEPEPEPEPEPEEVDDTPINMHWEGMGRIASMLADPSMFDSKEIEKPKKKGGFFNRLMKKDKSQDNDAPASPTSLEDEEEIKRHQVKTINDLIAKGDFDAVAKVSEKYKSTQRKSEGDGAASYMPSPPNPEHKMLPSSQMRSSTLERKITHNQQHFVQTSNKSVTSYTSRKSAPPKPKAKPKPKPLPLEKQFNEYRIAILLQDKGADVITASRVAKIVQSYALDWNRRNSNRLSAGMEDLFDVDEVMTVMTEYGLNGHDIASVFEQTPSVAMIKARADDDLPSEEMCKALITVIRG